MIINKNVSNKISVYQQPFLFSCYLMKYLLLLLLALPIAAQAQLEAGANYGFVLYKISQRATSSNNLAFPPALGYTQQTGYGGAYTLSYRFQHMVAGIGYDQYKLPLDGDDNRTHYYARPMRNVYAYGGGEFTDDKLIVAVHLMAGKSFVYNSEYTTAGTTVDGSGLLVACRLWVEYDIWHGLCLNLQGSGGAAFIDMGAHNTNTSDGDPKETIQMFSLAAGVHYRLQFRKGRESKKVQTIK